MIRAIRLSLAVVGVLSAAIPASAGPNADGYLVVHVVQPEYTAGDHPPMSGIACGEHDLGPSGTNECPPHVPSGGFCGYNAANPTSDGSAGEDVYWWVMAAFPHDSCPRVAEVVFGISFDAGVRILACGPAPWGLTSEEWLTSEMSATVTFDPPRTSHLFEVYWFLGYSRSGPVNARIRSHHAQQRMEFRDDSVPAVADPILAAGILGLGGAPGRNPQVPLPPVPTGTTTWGQVKSAFVD